MRAKTSLAFASALMGALAALATPADAACKKFGFTVNDYGKDGPTNDAKNLLDKHIAEWAGQNGVTDYQTGKKSVSCELFLDVILFDEHTCTASATVCWGPDAKKLGAQSAAAPETDESGAAGAPPTPVRKAHAMGHAPQQAATAPAAAAPAAEAAAPTDAAATQIDAAPTTPVEQIAAPAETPPAAPAVQAVPQAPAASAGATPTAVVETGALQAGQSLPQAVQKSAPTEKDRAAAAAAAASAAAAAERAAVAAETAANAAKEAAAAAVAASAASKGSATVPPLSHASGGTPAHAE